ncbi:hypothetical protein QBC34DRAFT_80583 [Podospora aff. communis PSN243]|uniref:Secreted protein n=1 Tax=Podospora aff. communis PSN243 TaxID=3040156 RepID=A0AAV9GNW8_9PEZI|nr:hypothetical protein QBC34DRAFT_80583 [Podospora aff. communis PSN243]
MGRPMCAIRVTATLFTRCVLLITVLVRAAFSNFVYLVRGCCPFGFGNHSGYPNVRATCSAVFLLLEPSLVSVLTCSMSSQGGCQRLQTSIGCCAPSKSRKLIGVGEQLILVPNRDRQRRTTNSPMSGAHRDRASRLALKSTSTRLASIDCPLRRLGKSSLHRH